MFTFKFLSLVALLCAFNSVILGESSEETRQIGDQVRGLLDPLLHPFNENRGLAKSVLTFLIGDRNALNDTLLDQKHSELTFPNNQNATIHYRYPETGCYGSKVTLVVVGLSLTSNKAHVDVVEGDIGEQCIGIGIQGADTSIFGYDIFVYGKS